jgi:hypothetical protein
MAFGGGSSGSAALTAHTHNAALAGDGGQLSQTLTDMGGVVLYSEITDNSAAVAANTAAIGVNTAAIAAIPAPLPAGTGSEAAIYASRWGSRTASANDAWNNVAWSPDLSLFCAVASDKVMYSSTGSTWTTGSGQGNKAWNDLVWSPDLSLFCAVAVDQQA